jgi:hypothetical protein
MDASYRIAARKQDIYHRALCDILGKQDYLEIMKIIFKALDDGYNVIAEEYDKDLADET